MKGITKIITSLIVGCSVAFGQSKQDISDFKEEFPKSKENVTAHVNGYFHHDGYHFYELSKSIPFVKVTQRTYTDLADFGKLFPYNLDKIDYGKGSLYHEEREKEQEKCYDVALLDLPKSMKKEATHNLPKGTTVRVMFIICEELSDKIDKLEFRTSSPLRLDNAPLRFRALLEKCFDNERKKIEELIKNVITTNDGWVFVEVGFNDVTQMGYTKMRGWVRLSDLAKQTYFTKKKKKKNN